MRDNDPCCECLTSDRRGAFPRFFPAAIAGILIGALAGCGDNNQPGQPLSQPEIARPAPLVVGSDPDSSAALRLADLRVLAYAKEFGDRFGYTGAGVSELPPELLALEFSVEGSPNIEVDTYSCVLKVYLQANLGLELPHGKEMSNAYLTTGAHFFAQNFDGWNQKDVRKYSERDSEYSQKAFLYAEEPYSGIEESMRYAEHYVQLYEGVDYLKLNGCMVFSDEIENSDIAMQLRLKLEGGSPDVASASGNEEAVLKLDLPLDFAQSMVRGMTIVRAINRQRLR